VLVLNSEASLEIVRKALSWICYCSQHGSSAGLDTVKSRSCCIVPNAVKSCPWKTRIELRMSIPLVKEAVVTKHCSSLIRRTQDGKTFELAHFSVLQYLRSIKPGDKYEIFRFDAQGAVVSLAEVCLRYLSLDDFSDATELDGENGLEEIDKKYPFCFYASYCWLLHIHSRSKELLHFAKPLFLKTGPYYQALGHWLPYYILDNEAIHSTQFEDKKQFQGLLKEP
jgi:hypothetical protein